MTRDREDDEPSGLSLGRCRRTWCAASPRATRRALWEGELCEDCQAQLARADQIRADQILPRLPDSARLRVTLTAGDAMPQLEPFEPDIWETGAEEFLDENGDSALTGDVRSLEVGGTLTIGGGAAPEFRIERIA